MRGIDEWPVVLAGPMLRRVDARSASVFVALSRPARVRLQLFAPDGLPVPLVSDGDRATVPLGRNLHVAVVTATPATPLAAGVSYAYDLLLAILGDTGLPETRDLASLGLLQAPHLLGYSAGRRPTFALAATLGALKVAYGSCRKPHGGGGDALALVDDLLWEARGADGVPDAARRPHLLLLTGDQVYADDVALPLSRLLVDTGRALLAPWSPSEGWDAGWLESIPTGEVPAGPHAHRVPYGSDEVAPGPARQEFAQRDAALTSTAADGHLLFLGEFYAMYLFAWSDELWPRAPGEWLELGPPPGLSGAARDAAENEAAALRAFVGSLRKARRALANVPTLTMFDDHEVTDDWNLDAAMARSTRRHAAGQRVLRNGLVAYALFQDWGNQPLDYGPGRPGAAILSAVRCAPGLTDLDPPSGPPPILAQPGLLDALLDLDPDAPNGDPTARKRWDHVLRCDGHQEHQVVALDTRTWRDLPEESGRAGLLSAEAVAFQLDARRPEPPWPPSAEAPFTLLVAPAPVFGIPALEAVQETDTRNGDPYGNDAETWTGNAAACRRFLESLARFRSIVVLSGDVHYAFTNHAAVTVSSPGGALHGRVVHACGTSLKNADGGTEAAQLLGARPGSFGVLGENAVLESVIQGVADLKAARRQAGVLVDHLDGLAHALRTHRLTDRALEATLTLALLQDAPARDVFNAQPEGTRFRVRWCEDAGPGERVFRFPPAPGDPPAAGSLLPPLAAPHERASRTIVGGSNLGLLTLAVDAQGAPVLAKVRLHRRFHDRVILTLHEAPLAPPGPQEATL